jgi:putative endonuclease
MHPSHAFGREAEARAEIFYRRQGFVTLARNFRAKGGEIDLVMRKRGLLVFVEVKGRRRNWERHAWAGDWRGKKGRLRRAIAYFLARHPALSGLDQRIEIAFVTPARVEAVFAGI